MNCMHLIQFHRTVLLVMCIWSMDGMRWREGWRCVCMAAGAPCVTMSGMRRMQPWFAGNWDTHRMVRSCYSGCSCWSQLHTFSLPSLHHHTHTHLPIRFCIWYPQCQLWTGQWADLPGQCEVYRDRGYLAGMPWAGPWRSQLPPH